MIEVVQNKKTSEIITVSQIDYDTPNPDTVIVSTKDDKCRGLIRLPNSKFFWNRVNWTCYTCETFDSKREAIQAQLDQGYKVFILNSGKEYAKFLTDFYNQ